MKKKYTKRDVRNNSVTILAIGYCKAYTLFPEGDAYGYSAGSDGWDCDYHMVFANNGGVTISTGYRTIGTHVNPDIVAEYEREAREARETMEYEEYREALYKLQKKFVCAVLNS
jgi:hypothetical protein